MNGGNLAFHLEKIKQFTEYQVEFLTAQILSGLLYLHDKGFVYKLAKKLFFVNLIKKTHSLFNRNLKLENVLLDLNGNSKICDFHHCINFVEREKDENGLIYIASTSNYYLLYYRPPEWHLIEYSADFWSLGVLIYKLLTGKFPFLNKESILNDDVPDLQVLNITFETKHFISSLLTKDFTRRLGYKRHPYKIGEHKFFQHIDWKKLEKREIDPPFKPNIVVNIILNIKIDNSI